MKKIFLFLCFGVLIGMTSFAQCGKTITWTAAKAEFLDDSGRVQDTKDVTVTIHTSSKRITIIHSDDESDSLAGAVKDVACVWKDAFKNGKSTIKADLMEKNGEYNSSTIIIEAKDSKIIINLSFQAPDGSKKQIRIPIDSYKEEG